MLIKKYFIISKFGVKMNQSCLSLPKYQCIIGCLLPKRHAIVFLAINSYFLSVY